MIRWLRCAAALILTVCSLLFSVSAAPEAAGKSALLMEKDTGTILYEKNAHDKLAPASVTKVMTMLLIMEAVDSGKITMEDMVTASETASAKGGSQIYLKAGETMSVRDMLKSIAVASANDCACAMAEYLCGSEEAFVETMNTRASQLGMNDTHFVNCTGLDDGANAAQHRTSAYDIAIMSRELLKNHPDIRTFTTIWMDTVRDGTFGLSNTNKLIRFYPGATGLKTGFTSSAGFCLSASAERDGMELIAVSMGCETSKIRAAACKAMLDYGFANYTLASLQIPEELQVSVTLGKEKQVAVTPRNSDVILIEKNKKNGLSTRIELPENVDAPVVQGQQLGAAQILSDGEPLCRVELIAAQGVEKVTFRDIAWELLRAVCGG